MYHELYAWVTRGTGFALVGASLLFSLPSFMLLFRQVMLVLTDGVRIFV
jgi:hypothetical protein